MTKKNWRLFNLALFSGWKKLRGKETLYHTGFHHTKHTMSAAKRAKLHDETSFVNDRFKNGYHHDSEAGKKFNKTTASAVAENEDKKSSGLSKDEIMKLRDDYIGWVSLKWNLFSSKI